MNILGLKSVESISLSALLIASTLVIFNSSAEAAEPNPVNTATDSSGSDEVAAASGSNRFVVWQDSTNLYEIFFRRSTDNGATWKPTVNLSNNPGDSVSPHIAVSGSNVYVVWEQHSADSSHGDIFLRQSTDNGATWKFRVKITSSGDVGGDGRGPYVVTSGSNVYVMWYNGQTGDTYFRRSTDNGATWKQIINVSNDIGDSRFPRIAASGQNVYVVWSIESEQGVPCGVFLRRSADSGATWKPVKQLDSECSAPVDVAVSGSNVYVVWGSEIISFRRSTDNGATWKPEVTLSDTSPSGTNPQMLASGSKVYVLWEERDGNGGHSDIFFRRSTDNGATWKSIKNVSNDLTLSYDAQIAISGSKVYAVWTRSDTNSEDVDVLFRGSTDNGATWQPVKNLSNTIPLSTRPELAASGSGVYVVWEEDGSLPGHSDTDIFFRRSTDNGATWQSFKNLSNNLDSSSMFAQIGL